MKSQGAVKDKPAAAGDTQRLCFWQGKAFYQLSRGPDGKLVEREAGLTRPKDLPFVKGGRRLALAEAERLGWGKAGAAPPVPKPPVGHDDDEGKGLLEPEPKGKPLDEGDGKVKLSRRPVRVSEPRRRAFAMPKGFPRITAKAPRLD